MSLNCNTLACTVICTRSASAFAFRKPPDCYSDVLQQAETDVLQSLLTGFEAIMPQS